MDFSSIFLYVRSLELNEQFVDEAKYLATLENPEEGSDKIPLILRISDDFYKGSDYSSSVSYLNKAHPHAFRLATAKPFLYLDDISRGNLAIQ